MTSQDAYNTHLDHEVFLKREAQNLPKFFDKESEKILKFAQKNTLNMISFLRLAELYIKHCQGFFTSQNNCNDWLIDNIND